ncbi:MAG: c-type cytochrome [Proteobacteria bacterium]|nr:c-type cytochrome [Pseudomonadota bacterium]
MIIKKTLMLLLFLIFNLYTITTFGTQLESNKKQDLANYTPILTDSFKELLITSNLSDGELYFMRKCSSCHDEYKSSTHGKGPNLWNIFGRKAGTLKGFDYSEAMRQSGHIWDYATLNYYLSNTKRAVPGRIMNFKGIRKDSDRAKLLLFLRSMNDKQVPLPK